MGKSLIISIAQTNPIVGNIQHNLDLIIKAWDKAPPNSDLIVFSEMV